MDMLHIVKRYLCTALVAALPLLFAACGEGMFDYEADCIVTHQMRFRYEMNLKWADAFPAEVHSVNLYAFDRNGRFVKAFAEHGEALAQPGYAMDLDLPVGDYKFVAWCGLVNEGAAAESFTVPQPVAGVTTLEELTCALNTASSQARAAATSESRLYFLYHGYSEETLVDHHDGTHYEYTMYLTKDTNHIRIILQELSDYYEEMKPGDYAFRIESANGLMGYDNALLGDEVVTYRPWSQVSDQVGVGKVDVTNGSLTYVKGVVADLSTCRMMAAQQDEMMLTIVDNTTPDQTVIARVPIIQYALLSRSYYEMAYGHTMTDQEFLDREDEYVFTFFLYKNRWLDSFIDIHSWRIVLHDYDVGS